MTVLNVPMMRESSSIWGDRMAYNLCSNENLHILIDLGLWVWWLSCKSSYWGWYRLRRSMNVHTLYICWKDTCIFMIFCCIRMWQPSYWSIRQCRKHNCPSIPSSGLYLQNILRNNVALNGAGREFGTQWRHTDVENEYQGTINDSRVILLIQALVNAQNANKCVINTCSDCDITPDV